MSFSAWGEGWLMVQVNMYALLTGADKDKQIELHNVLKVFNKQAPDYLIA